MHTAGTQRCISSIGFRAPTPEARPGHTAGTQRCISSIGFRAPTPSGRKQTIVNDFQYTARGTWYPWKGDCCGLTFSEEPQSTPMTSKQCCGAGTRGLAMRKICSTVSDRAAAKAAGQSVLRHKRLAVRSGAYRHPWRSNGRGPQQMSSAAHSGAGRKMLWEGRSEHMRAEMLRDGTASAVSKQHRLPCLDECHEPWYSSLLRANARAWSHATSLKQIHEPNNFHHKVLTDNNNLYLAVTC